MSLLSFVSRAVGGLPRRSLYGFLAVAACLACWGSQPAAAGDLSVFVVGGDLYVDEAPDDFGADNVVRVMTYNGKIRVENGNGRINGGLHFDGEEDYIEFDPPSNCYIDTADGNDIVVFQPGVYKPVFDDVVIDTGAYHNGPDEDSVAIFGVVARGSLDVHTGPDHDWIVVNDATVGSNDGIDFLRIYSGAGSDAVELEDSPSLYADYISIVTYQSYAEADRDGVAIERVQVRGTLYVYTGGGRDDVDVELAYVWRNMVMSLGEDQDLADMNDSTVRGYLYFYGGGGNDVLTLVNCYLRYAYLYGNAGVDSLNRRNTTIPTSYFNSWEWMDGRLTYSGFYLPKTTATFSVK